MGAKAQTSPRIGTLKKLMGMGQKAKETGREEKGSAQYEEAEQKTAKMEQAANAVRHKAKKEFEEGDMKEFHWMMVAYTVMVVIATILFQAKRDRRASFPENPKSPQQGRVEETLSSAPVAATQVRVEQTLTSARQVARLVTLDRPSLQSPVVLVV
ncbi:unnamed protein product [Cladocopium goreaui]|uniref:Uncharacterized protein n=1 Tax=Cladocopium goreaui TaxID=2562237 RepID=A0A9P1GGW9_9DINO|nr:unnamed protein product [Cladocopium goreaui]